jgi:hypothetical protein
LEKVTPVLLCNWRKSFHLDSSCQCSIWLCTFHTRYVWVGQCSTIGATQLREL